MELSLVIKAILYPNVAIFARISTKLVTAAMGPSLQNADLRKFSYDSVHLAILNHQGTKNIMTG